MVITLQIVQSKVELRENFELNSVSENSGTST